MHNILSEEEFDQYYSILTQDFEYLSALDKAKNYKKDIEFLLKIIYNLEKFYKNKHSNDSIDFDLPSFQDDLNEILFKYNLYPGAPRAK